MMAWSKSTRIKLMLTIDIIFFFIELGAGFAVHSLALMADAFHMVSPSACLLSILTDHFPCVLAQRYHIIACWAVGRLSGEQSDDR
jgi:Cation efflux family